MKQEGEGKGLKKGLEKSGGKKIEEQNQTKEDANNEIRKARRTGILARIRKNKNKPIGKYGSLLCGSRGHSCVETLDFFW